MRCHIVTVKNSHRITVAVEMQFYFLFILEIIDHLADELDGPVDSKKCCVEAGIIARRIAPFLGGIIIIVAGALFVLLVHEVAGLLLCGDIGISAHDLTNTEIIVGIDEQIDDVGHIGERVVSAASDKYAGTFLCELLDRIELCKEYLLADRHIHEAGCVVTEGISIHNQIVQERIGRTLILLMDHLLTEAAVLGNLCDEFLVIAGDPVMLCQFLPDLSSA